MEQGFICSHSLRGYSPSQRGKCGNKGCLWLWPPECEISGYVTLAVRKQNGWARTGAGV